MHIKARIFAILLIVVCAAMIYYGWHRLWEEGVYSLKMAAFAPLGVVGGFFLLLFPSLGGKPNTTKEKNDRVRRVCDRDCGWVNQLVPDGSGLLWLLEKPSHGNFVA